MLPPPPLPPERNPECNTLFGGGRGMWTNHTETGGLNVGFVLQRVVVKGGDLKLVMVLERYVLRLRRRFFRRMRR